MDFTAWVTREDINRAAHLRKSSISALFIVFSFFCVCSFFAIRKDWSDLCLHMLQDTFSCDVSRSCRAGHGKISAEIKRLRTESVV